MIRPVSNAADYTTANRPLRAGLVAHTARVMGAAALLAAALLAIDGPVARFCRRFQPDGDLKLGGDLKREMEFIQQFGGVTSLVITGAFIALLHPANRRRIRELLFVVLANALIVNVFKMTLGRPRPKFGDPHTFTLPWQTYVLPIKGEPQARHAWESWRGISSDLWSMPSSHTAAAFALALFLARTYPASRALVFSLACVVAVCRVLLGAHYPSDVVVGAALGYCTAHVVLTLAAPTAR